MLFLTHLLVGVLIGLVMKGFFSGGNVYVFFFLVLLGAILPDIDESHSKISRWSGLLGKVIGVLSKHRGFFHSLWFVVLMVLVMRVGFGYYYSWGLFLGLIGHLLSDGLTRSGINWFYPLKGLHLRGWMKTGGVGEIMVQVLVGALIVWIVVG